MRVYLLAILSVTVFFTSCKKKPGIDNTTSCLSGDSDGWKQEDLNKDYTIKFPSSYTNGGYIVFEGDYFTKISFNSTDTVTFLAQYGKTGVSTDVWGPVLINTNVASVDIVYKEKLVTLKNKKRICSGSNTLGYFFSNTGLTIDGTNNTCLGVVYLLKGSDYRQSLMIEYSTGKETEVRSVVTSIRTK